LELGFAFQDLAENSLASILLSLRQPFAPNDLVSIDGQQGKVVRLTSRATTLLTLDGNHLRIPNATVFKATILNFTRNPERRFTFAVGIDTEELIPRAQALAVQTLATSPGVLRDPPPLCLVETLGESTVELSMVAWVDQRASDYVKARSEAIRRIKEAFDEWRPCFACPLNGFAPSTSMELRAIPPSPAEQPLQARCESP
jgi:small-conductance mechanosensitive channel